MHVSMGDLPELSKVQGLNKTAYLPNSGCNFSQIIMDQHLMLENSHAFNGKVTSNLGKAILKFTLFVVVEVWVNSKGFRR